MTTEASDEASRAGGPSMAQAMALLARIIAVRAGRLADVKIGHETLLKSLNPYSPDDALILARRAAIQI
jgi:hypothetical protein